MKKEDLNSIIDGVANLLKVGLSNLIDEGDTLVQATRRATQPATKAEDTETFSPAGLYTLESLMRSRRQLDGDPEQVYRVLGVRPGAQQTETLVHIEMAAGGWRSVRKLTDVLNDPVVSD